MIEATNTKKRPRLGPKPRIESRRQFDQEIHKEGVCDMIRGDFDSNCENDFLWCYCNAHAETSNTNYDLDELMNN